MSEVDATADGERYLAKMKASKKRPAVGKVALAALRSALPSTLIFAFEGIDDKSIYYSWFGRIAANLRYEPLCCNGKTQVLELLEVVRRDRNHLGDGVYFFVDRDFDDLRGHERSPQLFMTAQYSVENYLVNRAVLEEVLKNEFHCHGHPQERIPVLDLFSALYDQFLQLTKPVNWRLFQARKIPIELAAHLPEKVSKLVDVSLDGISLCDDHAPEIVVRMKRPPRSEEAAALAPVFEELDPCTRFRGKFALLFFQKWLSLLAEDRNSSSSKHFNGIGHLGKANHHELTLSSLATKSQLPEGLEDFVNSIPPMAPA